MTDYGPFVGDGRVKMLPTVRFPGTQPMVMSVAAARNLIDSFVEMGRSNHSAQGQTVWVILAWLHYTRRRYILEVWPDMGIQIIHQDERPVT